MPLCLPIRGSILLQEALDQGTRVQRQQRPYLLSECKGDVATKVVYPSYLLH